MGFVIPLKDFMSTTSFQQKWNDVILPGIKNRNIFNSDELDISMRNLPSLGGAEINMLWLMTSFEIWAQQYLD